MSSSGYLRQNDHVRAESDRVAELKSIGDQARADASRAEGAAERLDPSITPKSL